MEDKFTSTEILDYINNNLQKDISLTRKLALYTQATEKQLDDSSASLQIWLDYIKILQECEYDESDIREMYKILVKKFFCYYGFWKEFIEFERNYKNHLKIVEKYEKWIVSKSFEEREKILGLFAKTKDYIQSGEKMNIDHSFYKTGSSKTFGFSSIRTPKNTTNGKNYCFNASENVNSRLERSNVFREGVNEFLPHKQQDENLCQFTFNTHKIDHSKKNHDPASINKKKSFSINELDKKVFSTGLFPENQGNIKLNRNIADSPRVRKVRINENAIPANLNEDQIIHSYRNVANKNVISFQGSCDVVTEEINRNITRQMRGVLRGHQGHEKIPELKCDGTQILFKNSVLKVIKQAGKGGGGVVYQVLHNSEIYALKKVKLPNDRETILQGYLNEISLLEKLRGFDEIIFLHDYEITDRYLLILMEYGETDLSFILKKNKQGIESVNYINYLWEQLLKAVNRIHQNRIIHRDLKPANFLMVQGRVKLIDFGIAKTIRNDTTHINIESQVGTINYMAPEAFDQERRKLGRSSDIWSLGCILYEMVYGRPPLDKFTNALLKIKNLQDESYEIEFPDKKMNYISIIKTIKKCLIRDQSERINIEQLLTAGLECEDKVLLERKDLKTLTKAVLNIKKNTNLNSNLVANSIVDEFLRKIKK